MGNPPSFLPAPLWGMHQTLIYGTITLGRHPETTYYQIQFQSNDATGPWDSSSRLYFGGLSGLAEPITALKLDSDDEGQTLGGTVTYITGKIVNSSGTVDADRGAAP